MVAGLLFLLPFLLDCSKSDKPSGDPPLDHMMLMNQDLGLSCKGGGAQTALADPVKWQEHCAAILKAAKEAVAKKFPAFYGAELKRERRADGTLAVRLDLMMLPSASEHHGAMSLDVKREPKGSIARDEPSSWVMRGEVTVGSGWEVRHVIVHCQSGRVKGSIGLDGWERATELVLARIFARVASECF